MTKKFTAAKKSLSVAEAAFSELLLNRVKSYHEIDLLLTEIGQRYMREKTVLTISSRTSEVISYDLLQS